MKKNKIFLLLIAVLLLTSFVYAADVAYVLKYDSNPEDNIISALNELNLSYELIDDSEIMSTSFDDYQMLVINDDNFGSLVVNIPVNEKNALFLSKSHVDEWHWASTYSTRSSSQTIKGRILITNSITEGFISPITLSSSPGSYYVLPKYPSRARSIDNIISTDNFDQYPIIASVEPGELLRDSVISEARGLFFGLSNTDNWNNNAKQIFKNSVIWVLYGNDRDDDGVYDEEDNCIDNYNPDQLDSDGDGIGDVCDVCALDGDNDIDEDSVCGNIDNCELDYNPLQENFDSDILGDVCDDDVDNDGVLEDDLCEFTKAGELVDNDGCANYQYIVINEVEFNPEDETQEWVELYNAGSTTINLAGWKIKDSRGRIDVISSGSISGGDYFVFEEWMSTLDFKNNDSLQLLDNESYIVDETGFLVDEENDGRTWQRRPDGTETWIFDLATKGLNNEADVIAPVVELVAPENEEVFTTDTITFNYRVTDNKASSLTCYFYADFDGVFKQWANETTLAGVVGDFIAEDVPDGEFVWNVKCSDGSNEAFAFVNRSIIIDDKPYMIGDIPSQNWDEDSSHDLDLKNYFGDEDNQNLTYNIIGNTNINASIAEGIAALTPALNWNGFEEVRFRACDEDKCIDSNLVQLNVAPINDAPVLQPINIIIVNEGQIVTINASATDVEGDSLTYTINDSRFTGSNPFTWQTGYTDAGEYDFEIIVNDGVLQDSETVHITVLDTNEPPHINPVDDININEDSGFVDDINLTAYDNDGTIVSYSVATENTSQVDCSVSDGKLGVTPALNWYGNANCTIQVTDDDGATGSTIVNIIVAPVNDAPIIDSYSPDFNPVIAEDGSQQFSVEWHDIDNLPLDVLVKWFVNDVQANMGNSFSFTATGNDAEVKVVVSDGLEEAEQVWDVDISLIPVAETYNGLTTDFSGMNEDDLDSIFPFILEKTGKGKIQFLDAVDLRNVVDFDNYADITSHGAGIDTTEFPSLKNKRARITFYNLSFPKTPTIYYNSEFSFEGGSICGSDRCSNINYNAGVLSFDVTGFSTFMAGETRTCSQQGGFIFSASEICTGNLLTAADTDSCCSIRGVEAPPKFEEDIDVCENITPELEVDIRKPSNGKNFEAGENINIEVKIKNPDNESIEFNVETYLFDIDTNEAEEDAEDEVKIRHGESENVEFELKISEDIEEDNFAIFVLAKGENDKEYCNQDYVKIDVEKPENKIIIENLEFPENVRCGDVAELRFTLKNVGQDDEDVILSVENSELGIKKEDSFELEEGDSKKKSFLFSIPEDAEGDYEVEIVAEYEDTEEKSANLKVSCEKPEKVVIKESGEKLGLAGAVIKEFKLIDKEKGQILMLFSLGFGILILVLLIIIVAMKIARRT